MNAPHDPNRTPHAVAVEPVDEQVLERTARILGPQCAAARCLTEARRRRARGESVAFYRRGDALLVGPPAQPTVPDPQP